MGVYSFVAINATITGPNGYAAFGNGSAAAKEGIEVEQTQDKNDMLVGGDGNYMHSMSGDDSGHITVRLLKTSAQNQLLTAMYYGDRRNPATWGQNTIVITDSINGDIVTAHGCAFKKLTKLVYAEKGGMNEWAFDCGKVQDLLGPGTPS